MVDRTQIDDDLMALLALSESDIDTSDVPETTEFDSPEIGRYSKIKAKNYDIRAIANWCLKRSRLEAVHSSNIWLNKLVFFIYEKALKENSILLSPARVEAWDHGPVFRELYSGFKAPNWSGMFESYSVERRQREIASEPFEPEDLAIFESVWSEFGHKSASSLRRISHQKGTPWDAVWNAKQNTSLGLQIGLEDILGREFDQDYGRH